MTAYNPNYPNPNYPPPPNVQPPQGNYPVVNHPRPLVRDTGLSTVTFILSGVLAIAGILGGLFGIEGSGYSILLAILGGFFGGTVRVLEDIRYELQLKR